MDFLAHAFQLFIQKGVSKTKENPQTLSFEKAQKSLEIFSGLSLTGQPANFMTLVGSRDFVGGFQSRLYLPETIRFFESPLLNKLAYQNLILISRAATHFNPSGLNFFQQRLRVLQQMKKINLYLDSEFENYLDLQKLLVSNAKGQKKKIPSTHLNLVERVFFYYLSRTEELSENELQVLLKKIRINETAPEIVRIFLPCNGLDPNFFSNHFENLNPAKPRAKNKNSTELKKKYASVVTKIELEKEKSNPVIHSFEKLETADEYHGGRKIDSGDDELQSHQTPLQELDLSKVTSGGEVAKSIFHSEEEFEKEAVFQMALPDSEVEMRLYPEWDYRKKKYKPNFCRLFVTHQNLPQDRTYNMNGSKEQHRIAHQWRHKVNAILSRPLLRSRLKDGDDIDYDQVIRDLPQIKMGLNVDGRWYTQKRPRFKDTAILILFDQSLSTDSWIQNKRIIDVIKNSLLLTGAVFNGVLETVLIAGTYSETHLNCQFNILKNFNSTWNHFLNTLDPIEPRGYTRLGPAIRHATSILEARPEKAKILILLSDGKPTDLDGYEGNYGVQDVKLAYCEAMGKSIKPFALALEVSAKQHFDKMFTHYELLIDPDTMAEHIFKILLKVVKG